MRPRLHILLFCLLPVMWPMIGRTQGIAGTGSPDISGDSISIGPIKGDIRNAVNDKMVVLLGEPTHGEGNVMSYKTEIVRYLHDSLGFNIIAFESGLYDLYYAQDLMDRDPNSDRAIYLNNSLFPVWTTAKEFQAFMDYIKACRSRLRIAGFDCQLSGKYSERYLADSLQAFINRYRPEMRIDTDLLAEVIASFAGSFSFPGDVDYGRFQKAIDQVIRTLSKIAARQDLPGNEAALAELYLQTAKNLKGMAVDYAGKKGKILDSAHFKASDSNIRDSLMAESLLALTRIYPGQKIVCWGGGTHFVNDTRSVTANAELRLYKSMGMRIKTVLGNDKVLAITFISPEGSHGLVNQEVRKVPAPAANSLEAALSTSGSSVRYLDLHSSGYENRKFISSALEYQPLMANWSRLFDGLIYLKAFEPARYIYERAAPVATVSDMISEVKGKGIATDEFTGSVIDAESKAPIAFATAHLNGNEAATVCNNKGEFRLTRPIAGGDSLVITAIGYQPMVMWAGSPRVGPIALARQPQALDSAVVVARRPDALNIIKAAVRNYELNYGNSVYSQYAYINSRNVYNDSVFTDADYTAEIYYMDMSNVLKVNFKEKNVNKFDSSLVRKIGVFNNMPYNATSFDIIRNGLLLTNSKYRGFRYTLIRTYHDSLYGTIYVLYFEADRKAARYTGDNFTSSMNGQLVIRKQDYAIISIEYRLVRKVDKMRKWARKYYDQRSDKPAFWNKIPESEQVRFYCNYTRNETFGKYFLSYANEVFTEKGVLQNGNAPLNLISDLSFFDLGQITAVDDPAKLPFSTFRRHTEVRYDRAFWVNFKFPMLNRYDD